MSTFNTGAYPPGCTQQDVDMAQPGYWDGADEPPQELCACEACGGEGHTVHRITVYEHGCGFPHDDIEERPCTACNGLGEFVTERKADPPRIERTYGPPRSIDDSVPF